MIFFFTMDIFCKSSNQDSIFYILNTYPLKNKISCTKSSETWDVFLKFDAGYMLFIYRFHFFVNYLRKYVYWSLFHYFLILRFHGWLAIGVFLAILLLWIPNTYEIPDSSKNISRSFPNICLFVPEVPYHAKSKSQF